MAAVLPLPSEGAGGSVGAGAFGAWPDAQLAEAVALFEAGSYAEANTLAVDALSATRPAATAELPWPAGTASGEASSSPWETWRAAMDQVASAHEDVGDPERAEGLYLRMLFWGAGIEHYRQGHLALASKLFAAGPEYSTLEDATWLLQGLQPEDGHAIPQVVGLLVLGEVVAAKAMVGIWTLASKPAHRPRIIECGGLELVAKALADFPDNVEMQAAGCGVLRLLCSGHRLSHKSRRSLASRLGGAEAIASAMRNHPNDAEVQREGCGALRAIAQGNPSGARRVLEVGGIGLCLGAVAGCPEDESVGEAACAALRSFGCATDAGQRAGTAMAEDLEAVVESTLRMDREAGLRFCEEQFRRAREELGDSRATRQTLLAVAGIFLEDASIRHRGVALLKAAPGAAPEAPGPLLQCMQEFPGLAKVQVPCCRVLAQITGQHLGQEEAAAQVAKSGALALVCQAMRDLPCNEELQELATEILLNVARAGFEFKTVAVKAGAVTATVTAMKRFTRNVKLQELCIQALTQLCDTVGRAANCARIGGLDLVVATLKRHLHAGRVAELGCIMLCMFCDDAKLRQHIVQAGMVPITKTILRSETHSHSAHHWASELLKELVPDGPLIL